MTTLRRLSLGIAGGLVIVTAGVGTVATEAAPTRDPVLTETGAAEATGASDAPAATVAPGATSPLKTAAPNCGAPAPQRPDGSRYVCSFVDDFTGNKLDTDKWLVQETWFSGMTSVNRDCYVNNPATVAVGAGYLALTARRNLPPFICRSPFGQFVTNSTASTVVTRDKFTQTYGRFEFRAKMPPVVGPGAHTALWLYPQNHVYGPWPHSGEIDVAEYFSVHPTNVYPSVHYQGENIFQSTGLNCPVAGASGRFHEYAVEWTPTVMRFFYDGALCFQHSWTPSAPLSPPKPFDQPFYLVLTQVWGHGKNAVTWQTPNSAMLLVDWVRVWK